MRVRLRNVDVAWTVAFWTIHYVLQKKVPETIMLGFDSTCQPDIVTYSIFYNCITFRQLMGNDFLDQMSYI